MSDLEQAYNKVVKAWRHFQNQTNTSKQAHAYRDYMDETVEWADVLFQEDVLLEDWEHYDAKLAAIINQTLEGR